MTNNTGIIGVSGVSISNAGVVPLLVQLELLIASSEKYTSIRMATEKSVSSNPISSIESN